MTGPHTAAGPLPPAVVEAAIAWMVRLQSGGATPQEHQACERWQQEQPAHAQAWQALNGFSRRLKTLPPVLAHGTLAATRAPQPRRRALLKGAALKGLVLVGGTSALALGGRPEGGWATLAATHRTGVGERQRAVLADGSVLQLDTDTALSTRFEAQRRCVMLWSGAVLVDCGPDRGPDAGPDSNSPSPRPFVVRTAQGEIHTPGGRFVVQQRSGHTLVQVLQGWLQVQPKAAASPTRRLGPGQQWQFDAEGQGPLGAADGGAGAWADGLLVARDLPLAELVAALARYRHGWLRCDPAVATLRISGVFPLDDPERVLAAIQRTLPVRTQALTRWWVTLVPR